MSSTGDTSTATVARLRGERIGHLSRYDRIDLLQEEMAAFAGDVQVPQARYYFRKAFFGAGGKKEHWERFAEPLLARYTSAAGEAISAAYAASKQAAAPSKAVSAPQATATPVRVLEAPPTAGEPANDRAPAPVQHGPSPAPPAEAPEEDSLPVSTISDRVIAVRPQSTFGAGASGGAALLSIVSHHIEEGGRGVLLDLSGTGKLRADASGPILACQLKLQGVGGDMSVVVKSEAARALLEATGLARRTPCFDAEEAAVAHLEAVCAPPPVSKPDPSR